MSTHPPPRESSTWLDSWFVVRDSMKKLQQKKKKEKKNGKRILSRKCSLWLATLDLCHSKALAQNTTHHVEKHKRHPPFWRGVSRASPWDCGRVSSFFFLCCIPNVSIHGALWENSDEPLLWKTHLFLDFRLFHLKVMYYPKFSQNIFFFNPLPYSTITF